MAASFSPAGPADPDPRAFAPADFAPRLGGWLIDFLIVSVLWLLLVLPLHLLHSVPVYAHGIHTSRYRLGPLPVAVDAALAVLYGGLLSGSPRGQTFGMMAAGTRVVRIRPAGSPGAGSLGPVGFPRAFLRAVSEYLMAVVFLVPWVLDVSFALWDPQRQTLHDKLTDTTVIAV
jgi:uncharacterized RDD family membrane protein YckC